MFDMFSVSLLVSRISEPKDEHRPRPLGDNEQWKPERVNNLLSHFAIDLGEHTSLPYHPQESGIRGVVDSCGRRPPTDGVQGRLTCSSCVANLHVTVDGQPTEE